MVIIEGSKAKDHTEGSTEVGAQQADDVGPPGTSLDEPSKDEPPNQLLHDKSHALQRARQVLAWTAHRLVHMPGKKQARWTEQ